MFKFLDFRAFIAWVADIPFRLGTVTEVLTLFSCVYRRINELLGNDTPGFGTWSVTKSSFIFPFVEKLHLNHEFSNTFLASATVLFVTSGTS